MILGIIMMVLVCLAAWAISSSVTDSLHSACVHINRRLNGCVEVAQHAQGKSKAYYLKIDVVRLKELKEKEAAEEFEEKPPSYKPPSYEITVHPTQRGR